VRVEILSARLYGYSRYIVHWALAFTHASQGDSRDYRQALERLPRKRPRIVRDNRCHLSTKSRAGNTPL